MIGQRFDSLDRLAGAAKVLGSDREGSERLPEIRNHAIAALGLTDMRALAQRDCGDVYSFSVDAALERYAVAERSGTVVVHRLDDDRELVRLPAPEQGGFWHAATMFSPDGELLVASITSEQAVADLLQVWHLGRRELLGSLQSQGGGAFYGGAFSPDSRRLLFCPPDGGIDVWDRGERRVVRRLPLDFAPHYLALDPEGRRLAVNNADEHRAGCDPRARNRPRAGGLELRRSATRIWRGAPTGNSWPSAAGPRLPRLRLERSPSRSSPRCSRDIPSYIINAQFAHTGYLLATASCGRNDPAVGCRLRGASGDRTGTGASDSRPMTAGWPIRIGSAVGVWEVASGDECRTLHPAMLGNRSERRDATTTFSGDVQPRRPAAGDRRRGRRSLCGRPTRVGRSPTSKIGACEDVLFHPDGKSLIAPVTWGLFRWPISPDPEHGPDAVRVGPPELLRESTNAGMEQGSLVARSSDAGADRQLQRAGLARRFEPSPPRPGAGRRPWTAGGIAA